MSELSQPASGINEAGFGQGENDAQSREVTGEFLPGTRPSRRPGRPRLTPEQLAEARKRRAEQRRVDMNSLDGLARQHARLIRQIESGRVAPEKGEFLGRAFGRHREILKAITERDAARAELERMTGIHEALERIEGRNPNALRITAVPRGEVSE